MRDFGLNEACNGHAVVLLDCCAVQAGEESFFRQNPLDMYSESDQMNYLKTIHALLGRNMFVTSGVAKEMEHFSRKAMNSQGIPRARKKVISQIGERISNGSVIKFTDEEAALAKDASLYFRFYNRFISQTDYDLLISAIATATYRGSTVVLTNDAMLINSFEGMTKFLPAGYIDHGMPRVPSPIHIYSKMGQIKFSEHVSYDPKAPRKETLHYA